MARRRNSNDTVNGSNRSELIFTGRGNDTINSNGGNDLIFAGSGNDIVNAGSGNDIVFGGSGRDQIDGGAGNDLLFGGSGADVIDGGAGNDRIFGGTGNDIIDGGAGNDRLYGGSGRDEIDGGSGNDVIFGGSGNDKINGGDGNDRLYGGSGRDEIDGGNGNDLIFGGSGNDTINGGAGDDRIIGGSGRDEIDGGDGNDLIFGGSGNDTIDGGAGRDVIFAGSGNDTLIYTLPETATPSSVLPDYYGGGCGFDTLRINLTTAQTQDAVLVAELSAYLDALDSGTSSYFVSLPSLNLTVSSIEAVEIFVDGVLTDIRDIGGGDVVAEDDSFSVGEDGELSDSVAGNDTAPAGAIFTVVTPVTEGTLALNGDGTFTYNPDGAYETLAVGETATQSFTYQVSQGGQTATATATITITGANDAPTVTSAVTVDVTEDDAVQTADLLQGTTDVDNGDVLSLANLTGLVSGLSLSGNLLEIDTSVPSMQALAAGETMEVTLNYDVMDNAGASVAQTATITITGTNDSPTVSGTVTGAATEDGAVQTIGLLSGASDIDTNNSLSISNVSALPAGVTLSGTDLNIDPSHADYQSLALGETTEVSVTYDIVDGDGGSVSQTATITITGANDAPTVAGAITDSINEDDGAFSLELLTGAADVDTLDTLAVDNVTGLGNGVSLNGTTLEIDPSDSAIQALNGGETREVVITYDVVDGNGGSVPQTATISITGANDAPVVSGAVTASVAEDAAALTVNLLEGASDPDAGTDLAVTNVSALPAGITQSGTELVIDASHADYQSLAVGASQDITVTYDVIDGAGGIVTQSATITITGTNDAPTVSSAIMAGAEKNDPGFDVDLLEFASDVDVGTTFSIDNVTGLTDGVTLSGTTLTVDPSNAAFAGLAPGEVTDIIISFEVLDGDGGRVFQSATISITGANDAPVVTGPIATDVSEDASSGVDIDLLAGASDPDGTAPLTVQNVSSLPEGFTLTGTTLTVDPSSSTYQALTVGQTLEVEITYDIADEFNATVPQTATITIIGQNDAPEVSAALTGSTLEDGDDVVIELLDGATDVDTGTSLDVANVSALPAGVTLTGTSLTVDPSNAAFQSLAAGVTQSIIVTYDVVDGVGGVVAQTSTITVTGTNDTPEVSAALTGGAIEDGDSLVIELLEGASDVDAGTNLDIANVSPLPDGITLSGTELTVDPSHAAFQSLAEGTTQEISVTYDVVDGDGGLVPQTATITITGTNDAPEVADALTANAVEDGVSVIIQLLDGASDVDSGTSLDVVNVSPLPPSVTLSGTSITIDPTHSEYQFLPLGDTGEIEVTYDIIDGNGGLVAQTLTITVTGTNDVPEISAAITATTNEDDAPFTFSLLTNASDVDFGTTLDVTNVSALPDGVTLSGTNLTVDPSHSSYQSLAAGATQNISVSYDVIDGDGGSVAQSATITITGTNDVPVVAAALTATATEDGDIVTIDLLEGASDVDDDGTDLDVANVSALPAGVTLSGTTLTVDPSNAAFQSLAAGVTQAIEVSYDVIDADGGSVAQSATITITGTNDTPTIGAALSEDAVEDGASFSLDLLTGANDVDAGADLSVQNVSTLVAGVTLAGNLLTINPSHAAFQSLAVGETQEILVEYEVVDDQGATVEQSATITITGTNDVPTVVGALEEIANEDAAEFTINLLTDADDVDNGTSLSVINVVGLLDGLTLSGNSLIVDPADSSFQELAQGEERSLEVAYDIVDGDGGTVAQSLTITITGTNDTPTVAAALSEEANEDDALITVDLLTGANDVDNGSMLSLQNITALAAGVTLSGNILTVDPSDASFQSLPVGETQEIQINYEVVDELGASVDQLITITIMGTNDVPTVESALTQSANEDDAEFTVNLLTGADDVDEGTTLAVTNVAGLVDGLELVGNSLTVDPADSSFQELAQGEERVLEVTYDIVDGDGGIVQQSLTVTITGTNDTPTVDAALSTSAAEDSADFTFELLTGANDVDNNNTLSVTNLDGLVPGVTLNGNAIDINPSHAAFQSLNVGQSQDISLTYDVEDEFGASVTQIATITITGTNDTPTVDAALVAETDEDDAVLTVNLLEGASDIDDGADLNVADVTGMGPGFTLNGNSLEIDPSVAAYQPIAVGEVATYTVNYNVVDEHGASVAQSATIAINGTNDTPVATGTVDTQYTVTDVAYSMTLDPDLFFDIDTSDTLTLSATLANGDPLPAWLTFDAATGTFSGTPNNELDALLFRVEVTATDPHGASAAVEFWLGQGDELLSGSDATNESIVVTRGVYGEFLFGGEGTDFLSGLGRGDVYVVTADNDLTVIEDNGTTGNDYVLLDDIAPADVLFDRRHPGSSDLVISVAGVPLVLVLNTLDNNSADEISFVAFGDGSIITIADIRATIISQNQTTGADIIVGFEASDTIDGGAGNDFLSGADSSDTYVFNTGDGQDVIEDNGFSDTDVVQFADRASTDATFSRVPGQDDSVLISFANGDSVLLRHGINGSSADGIEEVQFAGDGVTLTADQIRDILVSQDQTSGDDTITGFSRGETIEAGLGNDYIDGAEGADTYIFNSGDGQDVIDDNGFSDTDSIIFTNYALADATFDRVGTDFNDFVISFANGDQVYVNDSLNGQASGSIEQVIFQGTGSDELLTIANIRAIIFAQLTTTGNDNIDVGSNNLEDTLEGGQGDDFMSGGDGSDTYIFGSGDGRDVIHDNGNGDTDVLDLSDFASTDMTARFEWGSITNIVLSFATGEEITIVGQTSLSSGIESFIFSDTTLTNTDIKALADASTLPGDLFTGTIGADTLSGDGGHDFLTGGGSGDTYVFDAGDERVEIEDNGSGLGNTVVVNGYSSTDATFMRVGGLSTDLRIVFGGGDEIFIHNTLGTSSSDTIDSFTFNGDGVTLSIAEVRQILVDDQSTAGDDVIFGFADSDTLDGGTGDDYLSGGRGSDTYVFDVGDGNDVILDDGVGGTDRIEINGYDFSAATLTRVPGTTADVLIDFGSGDSIRMSDVLADSLTNGIEQIVFNGPGGSQTITMAEIRNILTSDQATAGDDTIFGSRASETLEGGLGDDYLSGGRNGDTYVYTFGDGNDVIEDNGGGSGDVLQLNGITFDNFSVARAIDRTNDVVLTMADGGTVRLVNSLAEAFVDSIETISLVDEGVALTMQDLREQILLQDSTSGDDDITGWSSNDTIMGGAGNDFLTGQGGSDTYIFNVGDGNDTVLDQGGASTDAITFNDRDIADATFSRLFDASNDLLIEFSNGDSVVVRETIPGGFVNRIEQYNFDDGTLSHADMVALL